MSGPAVTTPHLVTVSGQDGPGIAARLFAALAGEKVVVEDVEQVRVHGHLLLCVEVALAPSNAPALHAALRRDLAAAGVDVAVDALTEAEIDGDTDRNLVTLLAPDIDAVTLESVAGAIAACGGNIERIVRLAAYPVHSYELIVAGADLQGLRRRLAAAAAEHEVDIAVQAAGLHRRAKHLIVLDADSTLLQGEVIDLLAERCGCGAEVAAVTEAAMAGELDFEDALRGRVRLLAGLKETDLDAVRDDMVLTPGARTLVRTLKRLGYEIAVVSGGFTQVIEALVTDLGIDHLAANELALDGGVLTGKLAGPSWTGPARRRRWPASPPRPGVPVARTIAVGDGANDIDMLAAAGLGIAFNAKPVVRRAADTALSVPYLDAILFLLGISRREVEEPDRREGALP